MDDDTIPVGSIVGANDADVANDAVLGVNVILVAALAVIAFAAQLLVPTKFPVNDPLKLPVLICVDDDTNVGRFTILLYSTLEAVLAKLALNTVHEVA